LKHHRYSKLLIGVTGNATNSDLDEFCSCGADVAVGKPIKPETLSGMMAHCLRYGCMSTIKDSKDNDGEEEERRTNLWRVARANR
jgi:hypothetical protein